MQLNLPKTSADVSLLCFVQETEAEEKEETMHRTGRDRER